MESRYKLAIELVVGRRELSEVIPRVVFGIVAPIWILAYGASCILARRGMVIARGGLTEIIGLAAVSIGCAYVSLGIFVFIFICWDDHPLFAGVRDAALRLLLLAIAIAMALTFALALV